MALPQYDGGEALNMTIMLFPPGMQIDGPVIPMMHWHAGLFGRGTTNLVLRNELSAALTALNQELEVVGDIQRSLLPRQSPRLPGFELATYYQTARAGGDYYDFFPLDGGQWGLFIADVAGHGTPAAVLMAIMHAIAHAQPGTHTPPSVLLGYLNDQLARSYTREGSFVTAFYATLEPVNPHAHLRPRWPQPAAAGAWRPGAVPRSAGRRSRWAFLNNRPMARQPSAWSRATCCCFTPTASPRRWPRDRPVARASCSASNASTRCCSIATRPAQTAASPPFDPPSPPSAQTPHPPMTRR